MKVAQEQMKQQNTDTWPWISTRISGRLWGQQAIIPATYSIILAVKRCDDVIYTFKFLYKLKKKKKKKN